MNAPLIVKQPRSQNLSELITKAHATFEAQKANALRFRASTVKERIARIHNLRDAVQAAAPSIRAAAAADFRKPETEVDLTEIFTVISEANMAIRHLKRWKKPTSAGVSPLMRVHKAVSSTSCVVVA